MYEDCVVEDLDNNSTRLFFYQINLKNHDYLYEYRKEARKKV